MTTTPQEPLEEPQVAPAGDPGHGNAPQQEPDTLPDPEETVGPGVND